MSDKVEEWLRLKATSSMSDEQIKKIAHKSWAIVKTMNDDEIDRIIEHTPILYGKIVLTKYKKNRRK